MREQCIKQWLLTSKSLKYDITVLTMYIYRRESSLFVVSLLALMHFDFHILMQIIHCSVQGIFSQQYLRRNDIR